MTSRPKKGDNWYAPIGQLDIASTTIDINIDPQFKEAVMRAVVRAVVDLLEVMLREGLSPSMSLEKYLEGMTNVASTATDIT